MKANISAHLDNTFELLKMGSKRLYTNDRAEEEISELSLSHPSTGVCDRQQVVRQAKSLHRRRLIRESSAIRT